MVKLKKKPKHQNHNMWVMRWLIPIAFGIWATFFVYTHTLLGRHDGAGAHASLADHPPAQLSDFVRSNSQKQQPEAASNGERRNVERPGAMEIGGEDGEEGEGDEEEGDEQDGRKQAVAVGGVTLEEAEQACALARQRQDCITDVMEMGDLSYAKMYAQGGGGDGKGDDDTSQNANQNSGKDNEENGAEAADNEPDNQQANDANHHHHVAAGADGVTLHEAQIACALAVEKGPCIHDVMGIGDVGYADMYEKHPENHLEQNPHGHRISQSEAETACRPLFIPEDQQQCLTHVLGMNDLETAKHYVHLLRDAEMWEVGRLSEAEARDFCDFVLTETHPEQLETCRNDLQALPNKHVADHYIDLLKQTHDLNSSVSMQNAEKLCNHLKNRNERPNCIRDMQKLTAKDAAAHYFELQQQQGQEGDDQNNKNNNKDENKLYAGNLQADNVKGAVTLHEAQVACALVSQKEVCIHDVLAMGDVSAAEMYNHEDSEDLADNKSGVGVRPDFHHQFTQKEAETACRPLFDPDDQEKCIRHVLGMNDPETAKHYVHLLQDAELLEQHETQQQTMHVEGAQSLCAHVEEYDLRERCMKDVLTLPNIHTAEHYVDLLQQTHDGESLVSRQDAEKLCNHLVRDSRPLCVESLVKLNAKEAATRYYELHQKSGSTVE